ncbi:hypothetical protein Bca52824_086177 [Brassica carinata]|uniref:Uncharacterized protein n=1 Tax=Brassica carinata TaxID=52824 RepID=A0A8X7PB76_BRACI|nr:hypothetical protein Bca52824_086177 [Brassica carinata]
MRGVFVKDEVCPLDTKNTEKSPEKKREGRDESGAWYDGGKYDDRARSYKGVVINGNANQQNKEREGREFYGKGKGKIVEETYSKWMKVSERGSKRAYNNCGNYRGDGEASRYRPAWRGYKAWLRVDKLYPLQDKVEQQLRDVREEVRELAKAQADGTEVISDPIDADQWLAAVHGMQEDQVDLDDEGVMDMYEIMAHLLENGIDMDLEDF